jgi:hypothetical protein
MAARAPVLRGKRWITGIGVVVACAIGGAPSATALTPNEDHLYWIYDGNPHNAPDIPSHQDPFDPFAFSVGFHRHDDGWSGAENIAVSPDGQTAVYEGYSGFGGIFSGSAIVAAGTDGSRSEVLMDSTHDGHYWRYPRFTPDGRFIILNRQEAPPGYEDDIYLLSRSSRHDAGAPELFPLITLPGDQYDGVFSPDGSKFYFASNATPTGDPLEGFSLYAADGDGSDPEAIDGLEGFVDIWTLQVSPDGSRLIFGGLTDWNEDYDIYSIGTNGQSLVQLTSTPEMEIHPSWSPDGQKITFQRDGDTVMLADADGTDVDTISTYSGLSTFRQPSAFVSASDIQAAKFRPRWYFDDSENWRPLNVDMFMAERDPGAPNDAFHKLCDGLGCDSTPLLAGSDVEGWADGWLDIGSIGGSDPDDFYSPRTGCTVDGLRDCDGGDKSTPNFNASAVYYNATDSPGSYRYLDYWKFYRYNDLSVDEHEGDWEGVTVVPSLADPEAIEAVAMSQHTSVIWYLPGSLSCDDGGSGSCEPGRRPWVYIASGSHASYASPCENQALPPQVCLTPANLPEGDHKGDAPWGRNDDDPGAGALLEFPDAGNGEWVDWPGRWGNTCAPLYQCYFPSPSSPGVQHRFTCPWDGYEQELCPGGAPQARSVGAGDSRAVSAQACGNWMAPDLAAAACSPSLLRTAITDGALGAHGGFRISRSDSGYPSASAQGVAQLGGGMLVPGDTVSVSGTAPDDTQLVVKALEDGRLYEARFEELGLRRAGRVQIKVRRRAGEVRFAGRTRGRPLKPVEVRVDKIR